MSIPPSREQTEGYWGNLAYITYLKLREGIDALSFEQKISAMADDKYDQLKESGTSHHYFLQPLKAIHLQSRLRRELEPPGNPTNLKILAGVGAFILIMTILNFTSLAAVSSSERIGEVGVRKILGARQGHLMRRFLIESGVMIVAATLAAFGLAMTGLSQFNSLASSGFETTDLFQHRILSILPVFILVVLIGGGLHPALVMASFGPGSMVRGLSKMGKPRANLRSLLVIGQFTIAVSMLVCTATIQRQIRFMSGRHPGLHSAARLR